MIFCITLFQRAASRVKKRQSGAEDLPGIRLIEPEGTYLVWLDCSELGISGKELDQFIVEKAGLWLDGGAMFGPSGADFQRVNIACPRATLELALDKLKAAVDNLG